MPVRCRDAHGRPREVRISLRTRDPVRARILALEFNLALERATAMSGSFDPRMIAPWTITTPGLKLEIKDAEDQRLFQLQMRKDPDFRAAVLEAIRPGANGKGLEALLESLKEVAWTVQRVRQPTALRAAVEAYVGSRGALGTNRRATAGEKERTLGLLLDHLEGAGRDMRRMKVHELARPDIIAFVEAYASRTGKGGGTRGLSPRTVMKAVGHIRDFLDHAVAQEWASSSPIDEAFHKAIGGLRTGASRAKTSGTYDVFDDHDLRLIFEPRRYLERNNAGDDFWAPLVGLFTGARLGEIVCLTPETVVLDRDSGLHCLKIGTKNENSRRLVPVPEQLVSLGFIKYVDHVRSLDATTLFPHREMNATRVNDPSKHVSRVFGQHLNAVGITDPGKVFHSFRHTTITRMHVRGVPTGDSELIAGHAAQDMLQRLGAAGSRGTGRHNSTHLDTYVHADAFEQDHMPLQMRLKGHMDRTLDYSLDMDRLRTAARIVLEHVKVDRTGARPVYSSGWHTNKRVYAERMIRRLDDEASVSG